MSERNFGRLKTYEGRNSISNVSPTSIGGMTFPMVQSGAPPPFNFQLTTPKLKGKKMVAPTFADVSVGGKWLDAAIVNIIDLYEEKWCRCNQEFLANKH